MAEVLSGATEKKPRSRLPDGSANPVDTHIGSRVRYRRTLLGLTQSDLATGLGVAFQQIQKYESGINRISTARLWGLAQQLDCPVSFFYDGIRTESSHGAEVGGLEQQSSGADIGERNSFAEAQETIRLVRAYYGIRHPETRQKILALATSLGSLSNKSAL